MRDYYYYEPGVISMEEREKADELLNNKLLKKVCDLYDLDSDFPIIMKQHDVELSRFFNEMQKTSGFEETIDVFIKEHHKLNNSDEKWDHLCMLKQYVDHMYKRFVIEQKIKHNIPGHMWVPGM